MLDLQRIADDINTFLDSTDQIRDADLEPLATAYAKACKDANVRLRRCGDLLQRGLRSEAIHLADEPPNLLDLTASLDLPRLSEWEAICAMYNLQRPQRLLIDVAAELNEAYALEQPLESALSDMRLLALAKAPLQPRLEVLRRIAAADPLTIRWTEDIGALETLQLSALSRDAKTAIQRSDFATLHTIGKQLSDQQWTTPPPHELVEMVFDAELNQLCEDMSSAQSKNDVRAVRNTMAQIDAASRRRGGQLPASIVASIKTGQRWLAAQDQRLEDEAEFAKYCATLQHELNRNADTPVLEAIYARVVEFGLPVPEAVKAQYDRVLRERQALLSAGRRRNFLLLVTFAIVIAIAIVYYAVENSRASNATNWSRKIAAAINQGQLDDAQKLWDSVSASDPKLAARPELVVQHQALEKAHAAERQRLVDFARLIEDAKATDVEAKRRQLLSEASKLSRSNSEKLQVRELQTGKAGAGKP